MKKMILGALRTSEFWTVVSQATIEAVGAPVPAEMKMVGWLYVGLRVLSKATKFVFPNPDSTRGGWFMKD